MERLRSYDVNHYHIQENGKKVVLERIVVWKKDLYYNPHTDSFQFGYSMMIPIKFTLNQYLKDCNLNPYVRPKYSE